MAFENTPLDAPTLKKSASKPTSGLRIVQILSWVIEGMIGFIVLIGLLFKLESWEGGSVLLILGISSLMMFYLIALWVIAGSRNWRQGLFTLPVAFAMMLGMSATLFRWESWQFASELSIIGFLLLIVGVLAIIILMVVRYSKSDNKPYYWHLLIRMLLVTLLTAKGFFWAFGM